MKISWPRFKRARVTPILVGRILDVDLPKLDIHGITAKVDTGAFSGALHATDIHEHKRSDGATVLQFKPLNCGKTKYARSYTIKKVKSSNGVVSQRYTIKTTVQIKGQTYPLTITLTDRSDMRFQMLIGRKFLRSHGFLVDVSKDKT